ncbi:hypothetical protein SAMN04515647_1088 [Cohaesibacter sp. ES.047]|uniref:hypothetical protein n=1 Tax=Cohaesibacter sp. ES.047 TaxID=1798205 RepID=UPI000BB7BA87|nr:hypothetical protein [Cohaesibacter sp. ES.047]SNY90901.1 hypothetical protein SAMN04515647_1088 [Cohaesibacter sp. ES.047]
MTINADMLRIRLTRDMAEAVDEADSFETYFGDPKKSPEFGVARADNVLPADLLFLWEFAGHITDYIIAHGVDALELVDQVGNLFLAYQALKARPTDFDDEEKAKIMEAVAESLRGLSNKGTGG